MSRDYSYITAAYYAYSRIVLFFPHNGCSNIGNSYQTTVHNSCFNYHRICNLFGDIYPWRNITKIWFWNICSKCHFKLNIIFILYSCRLNSPLNLHRNHFHCDIYNGCISFRHYIRNTINTLMSTCLNRIIIFAQRLVFKYHNSVGIGTTIEMLIVNNFFSVFYLNKRLLSNQVYLSIWHSDTCIIRYYK